MAAFFTLQGYDFVYLQRLTWHWLSTDFVDEKRAS
jgi:hypothetical protein